MRVGIVSWNTAAALERCLRCLPGALGDLDAEVVVVDNASVDDTAGVVAAHPGVRWVPNPDNVGYARAMNQALASSPARYLIACNPDTEPPPGSLARLVAYLEAHPDVGLVAPRLLNEDGTLQHSVHRFPSSILALVMGFVPHPLRAGPVGRRWWLEGYADHTAVSDIDWAVGALHCIRAAALSGEDPFRTRWFMYAEDLDVCWRLRQRGWRVVLDGTVAVPHAGNVAGEIGWGARREVQWMDAVYDWYRLVHGPGATRLWAGINLVATTTKVVSIRAASLARPALRSRLQDRASLRQGVVATHARKLVSGGRSDLAANRPSRPSP